MAYPTNKTVAVDGTTDVLATHINKLEDKVGIDSSSDADSLDYRIAQTESDITQLETDAQYSFIEGMGMMWYGAIADIPSKWILADGTELNRTTYASLFANIGVVHGVGNGTTTFAIPNNTNKMIVGASSDDSGVPKTNVTGSLTKLGGSYNHTNTIGELAYHGHSDTFAVSNGGGHSHGFDNNFVLGHTTGATFSHKTNGSGTCDNSHIFGSMGNIDIKAVSDHGHGFTGSVSSYGGGNAYSIMNPYIAAAYIIYAGV